MSTAKTNGKMIVADKGALDAKEKDKLRAAGYLVIEKKPGTEIRLIFP